MSDLLFCGSACCFSVFVFVFGYVLGMRRKKNENDSLAMLAATYKNQYEHMMDRMVEIETSLNNEE
jgi:hypothetical protein